MIAASVNLPCNLLKLLSAVNILDKTKCYVLIQNNTKKQNSTVSEGEHVPIWLNLPLLISTIPIFSCGLPVN